jgi:hypothetical protein
MRRTSIGWSVVMLVAIGSDPAMAQIPTMDVGTLVRVRHGVSQRVEGKVQGHTPDTLTVVSWKGDHALPVASIWRVDVANGRSRGAGARRGVKIGSFAGAGVSLCWVGAWLTQPTRNDLPILGGMVATSMLMGVLYGSVIGTMTGATRWETAYPARR